MTRFSALIVALALLAAPAWAEGDDAGYDSYPKLRIGGFSDFDFYATDEKGKDNTSGFQEGQFVLHFTSALSKRIFFFGEISLTAKSSEFKVEVERTIIKFAQSDAFKISFGRYHTPINWWNTAFHHGQWLQTSVSRPEMTRFGGDFIPVHFVGGLLEGTVRAGGVNLGYEAGIGNGRHEIISRGGDAGDVNNSRAWLVNLSVKPDALYGFAAGVSFYDDRITLEDMGVDETIASAYVVYTKETPEVLAEVAKTTHDVDGGGSYDGLAYYAQVAYRLSLAGDRFKPYVRYEKIDVEAEDPVYGNIPDRQGYLAGVRYDLSSFLAVKVEYRHQRSNEDDYVNGGYAQVSFAF